MASSFGNSWLRSWGNSWGQFATRKLKGTGGQLRSSQPERDIFGDIIPEEVKKKIPTYDDIEEILLFMSVI
jgi:hypothetical protein